jgi:pimeloyl-ACP methyl ester carboxylesterase
VGGSGRVKGDYPEKDAARHLAALLGNLNHKKVLLAGANWGGPTAYALAANSPDLVRKAAIIERNHARVGRRRRLCDRRLHG